MPSATWPPKAEPLVELKPWLWAGEPDCSSLNVGALHWSELGGSADLFQAKPPVRRPLEVGSAAPEWFGPSWGTSVVALSKHAET